MTTSTSPFRETVALKLPEEEARSIMEKHLLKLRARAALTPEEESVLRGLVGETYEIAAKRTVIRAGERLTASTLLLEGLMCRYKDLADGGRQITELHVAGDFVDLHSFSLKRLDHNIMALTACRIALVPHDRLTALTENHPHLTRLYWFTTNLDAAIHREWELSLGRRSAIGRIAHLLCELHARLKLVGLAESSQLPTSPHASGHCGMHGADPCPCEIVR